MVVAATRQACVVSFEAGTAVGNFPALSTSGGRAAVECAMQCFDTYVNNPYIQGQIKVMTDSLVSKWRHSLCELPMRNCLIFCAFADQHTLS